MDRPSPGKPRRSWVLPAVLFFVGAILIAMAVAALLLSRLPALPVAPPDPAPIVERGLGGPAALLAGAFFLFLLLVPFYLIGFALVLCCCCKCGALPTVPQLPGLPELPDLRRLAGVLRATASQLETLAGAITGTTAAVDGARDTLTNAVVTMSKPVLRTHDQTFGVGKAAVTVKVLDGIDWEPVFNDDQKAALRALGTTFGEDAAGKTVLDRTADSLRTQASGLRQQASALDGQPA